MRKHDLTNILTIFDIFLLLHLGTDDKREILLPTFILTNTFLERDLRNITKIIPNAEMSLRNMEMKLRQIEKTQ